jgi:hypothetical protein
MLDGTTTTRYEFSLLNLSDTVLYSDRLTVYGVASVATEDMALEVTDIAGAEPKPLDWNVPVDTGNRKIIEITIPYGLLPYHQFAYTATMRWPFGLPLAGTRYYTGNVWALTCDLELELRLPAGYRAANLQVEGLKAASGPSARPSSEPGAHDETTVAASFAFPAPRSMPTIKLEALTT